MTTKRRATKAPLLLGIEGGGTRTVALLADAGGRLLQRAEFGPANLRFLSDGQLVRHLRAIRSAFARPAAVAIGLAGARGEKEWWRIRQAAARVWPKTPCVATNDLETALAAADPHVWSPAFRWRTGRKPPKGGTPNTPPSANSTLNTHHSTLPHVLVLSGTGSCFYGRAPDGKTLQVGGWGHLLGDKGSGYEIGLRALKAVVYYLDRDGEWSRLGQQILRAQQLNEPQDLIEWAQSAAKADIAALTEEVFRASARRDKIATDILASAAHSLAKDAASCARRIVNAGAPVQFVLAGSVLLKQSRFARQVTRKLKQLWPGAIVTPLKRESVWGAVALAGKHSVISDQCSVISGQPSSGEQTDHWKLITDHFPKTTALSPTEQRHPLSMNLDRLPLAQAIALMLREDEKIPLALLAERKKIERAVRLIARAFKRDGRLFYVGAGTSGRLGILDASECPPTFRAPPEMVQGIIAGGARAITTGVEGAEDDAGAGARAIQFRGVTKRDVVVGIAASGRTPFVLGALEAAKRRGAATVLICFNPRVVLPRAARPSLLIAPDIGPEILTGSTRLKAGTATKLLLNIFTTLAMVRTGKVLGNLMADLNPSNVKLRDRAVRIVQELTGANGDTARAALEKSGWVVKKAVARLGRR